MILLFGIILCLFTGLFLFRKKLLTYNGEIPKTTEKLSVIIPARNEEKNLPKLLQSLQDQTHPPDEIIVVNDQSTDRTKEIAESFGVKVIDNHDLPRGWTGKNWALWNGAMAATGDLFLFLDADISLAPEAIKSLLVTHEKQGGVISVIPFHQTEQFYERFALLTNVLGAFVFMSPFEVKSKRRGLYGPCILTKREDYKKINGHASIRSEVLDDLSLGRAFVQAGIPVQVFLGKDLISYRMYPNGFKSELQGFAKSAVGGAQTLRLPTLIFIILWLIGLILSESFIFFLHTHLFLPLFIGYLLYTIHIFYIIKDIGNFGLIIPTFHILTTIFFIVMFIYSAYQTMFRKSVLWKDRYIPLEGKRRL